MTLLIDNYDSFSYNLYQLVGELDPGIRVIRNDELTLDEIRALHPAHIILSPGPGRPEDAGITLEAARTLGKEIPTLGVCLGHQAICAAFGATVTYAKAHARQAVGGGIRPGVPAVQRLRSPAAGGTVPLAGSRPRYPAAGA